MQKKEENGNTYYMFNGSECNYIKKYSGYKPEKQKWASHDRLKEKFTEVSEIQNDFATTKTTSRLTEPNVKAH